MVVPRFIAAACLAALAALAGAVDSGVSLGPALILVRDVPVGRRFSLGEAAQVRYALTNNSDEPVLYSVKAVVPDSYNFAEFETGYEPAPDAAWFRLDREEVEIPARGRVEVDLTVDIPDRPELRNRHWIVAVEAGRSQKVAIGAALRLRARIMLETVVAEQAPGAGSAEIALAPAVVRMRRQADGSWAGEATVRNGTAVAADLDLLGPADVHPGELQRKVARYFERPHQALLSERWVAPMPTVHLEANGAQTLRLTAAVHDLKPGEARDEIAFVARRQRGETQPQRSLTAQGVTYERVELLRLRYEAESAPAGPAKP